MLEAIEIQKYKNHFIEDEAFEISNTWISVISKLKPKTTQESGI